MDGFVKFDLSAIPDGAVVESVTLTTWQAGVTTSPFPAVNVYRAAGSLWSSSTDNLHPGLAELLTAAPRTNFTEGINPRLDWALNTGAINWSPFLTGEALSLVTRNESNTYSWLYQHGANVGELKPTLTVTYRVGADTAPAVPEPSSALLFLPALGVMAFLKRRSAQ